ncbi:MAG TPA: hypothetical protein VHN80_25300, partial [Kineosporiaceae bacterium]|nr:hypothetical protein [Kineosporiaceae bacterium]
MKYFTEHLPATFVYAGIDVERSGLFTGIRGRQLAGRCVLLRTSAFGCVTEWHQLIAALEGALRLHAHAPGILAGQARYLHQRTGWVEVGHGAELWALRFETSHPVRWCR